MSTFGGDSWVPEAVHRKRRVEELLGEEIEENQLRRLSNGGLACLVCPNCPVLDTMPMVILHRKGARHQAAAEEQREKKHRVHEEIQKRIALGSAPAGAEVPVHSTAVYGLSGKKTTVPLLEATKNVKAAVLSGRVEDGASLAKPHDDQVKPYVRKRSGAFFESHLASENVGVHVSPQQALPERTSKLKSAKPKAAVSAKSARGRERKSEDGCGADELAMQKLRDEQRRESRLREAGWRRDGAGGWFRDENVEFDSDEEVPSNHV